MRKAFRPALCIYCMLKDTGQLKLWPFPSVADTELLLSQNLQHIPKPWELWGEGRDRVTHSPSGNRLWKSGFLSWL